MSGRYAAPLIGGVFSTIWKGDTVQRRIVIGKVARGCLITTIHGHHRGYIAIRKAGNTGTRGQTFKMAMIHSRAVTIPGMVMVVMIRAHNQSLRNRAITVNSTTMTINFQPRSPIQITMSRMKRTVSNNSMCLLYVS